jgi:hypothetical protein
MDMLRAGAFESQKMIMDAPREEITVDEVIQLVGMRPTKGDHMKLGKLFAAEFHNRYKQEPMTWVDGAQWKVKCYEKKKQDWMVNVARNFYGLGSDSDKFTGHNPIGHNFERNCYIVQIVCCKNGLCCTNCLHCTNCLQCTNCLHHTNSFPVSLHPCSL